MSNDLYSKINALYSTFSKGQKKIADTILKNYDKAAYMTAAKLGELCGVSESTVVRFAAELGFDGYQQLQHAMKELVRAKLTPNQRIEVTNQLIGGGDLMSKVLLSDIEKIKFTLERIDRDAFDSAVERIIGARNIYIIGVRASSSLASFLSYSLNMIFDGVRYVQPTSGSEMFEQILDVSSDDVMIAISFPRYSTKVINAVKYAKTQGTSVIALTDSRVSPLAEHADCLLTAQSDMASFVDSLVAPLSIINALIVAIAKEKQEEVAERFDRLEKVWDQYDVYAKH